MIGWLARSLTHSPTRLIRSFVCRYRRFGWTALYEAAGTGNRHVLERLVQAGANPKIPATVRMVLWTEIDAELSR